MGAYYQGTVNHTRYETWSIGQGAKLMEHSYIGNNYVGLVMDELEKKPAPVRWVCDYSENEDGFDWEKTTEASFSKDAKAFDPIYFIYNHTKNVYIDMAELISLFSDRSMMMHPIPILCNSETESMGGGDLHQEESRRGTWYGDTLEVVYDRINVLDALNVTEEVKFVEGE